MSPSETQQPAEPPLLTKQELARRLALSTRTIGNYVRRGMPYVPCGNAKRFHLPAVLQWLADEHERRRRQAA